ncbi:amidase [Sporolactobacillus kofuensis]|uniref:Amidase n=1 Tax=Sporolactobacillus kofuensis TaxID=269672 RepID=A0ABW1WFL8_9BACL|nr:amidase [Sporolactobacillus kofuensis]MCO7174871.1 amidase [Sporolactobacillus kofuensis]
MRKPDLDSLKKITTMYHLSMDDEELKAYQEMINESFLESYMHVDHMVEPDLPVNYKRTPGHRPTKEENPLNAWYWKTEIDHAETGKLSGKRIALKDNISVAGVPMMNGTKVLEGFIPQIDATIVSRILDEGGKIKGKAVCESLCCDCSSFTSDTGPVLNPHNTAYSAGGSSSGSAALVASGDVDMAIGCDQTGSIRMPSSWCGILGLKPSWGLVPFTGIFPVDVTLDHVGPMARTVEDIALLLEVIAGPDGLDPRQYDLQSKNYSQYLTGDTKGLRIGVVEEGFRWQISEMDVDLTVREAAESFQQCGATVESVSIPMHREGIHLSNIINTEGSTVQMFRGNALGTSWRGYHQTQLLDAFSSGMIARADDLSAAAKITILTGEYMQQAYHGRYYAKAQNLARQLKKEYDKAFQKFDVLIMPTVPYKATKLPDFDADLKEIIDLSFGVDTNTGVFDLTGHPALNVPCGATNGLPIGMMLIGRVGEEETILRAAHAFETMTHGIYEQPVGLNAQSKHS